MPHPAQVEQAANALEAIGRRVDAAIADHIVNGTRLPTISNLLAEAYPLLVTATRAAYLDIDPDAGPDDWMWQVDDLADRLAVTWQRAFRDAQQRRVLVERAPVVENDDGTPPTLTEVAAAGGGFGAAVQAVRRARRKTLSRQVLRQVAAEVRAPMPRITAATVRQTVRTELANGRNLHAARLADARGLVIRVEDARKGPTDEECERVNGLFATALWLRRHPTSHPNCTRRGRPVRLPPGARVTLLE